MWRRKHCAHVAKRRWSQSPQQQVPKRIVAPSSFGTHHGLPERVDLHANRGVQSPMNDGFDGCRADFGSKLVYVGSGRVS